MYPSEHKTHLKRFKHCIKAFQHFWCPSEMHWKRISWTSWIPSEHETHLKRFKHWIKAFQHFWCASEIHWKRIHWTSWIKVKVGIIDALLCAYETHPDGQKFKCALHKHIGCVFNMHQRCIYVFTSLKRIWSAFEVHISLDGTIISNKCVIDEPLMVICYKNTVKSQI